VNSCAPPPVPRITPISRFSSCDMNCGFSPASAIASADAAIASGTEARNMFALARVDPGQFVEVLDFRPPTWTGKKDGSKRRDLFLRPTCPREMARQNSLADAVGADHGPCR